MTRYFYTDPLGAAWMAKHFGMRFVTILPATMQWDNDERNRTYEFRSLYFSTNGKTWDHQYLENPQGVYVTHDGGATYPIYIHPDSLHLLEPQPGDLIQVWREIHATGGFEGFDQTWGLVQKEAHQYSWAPALVQEWLSTYYNDSVMKNVRKATIIQRNGLAFMWPEKEE